MKLVTFGDSWVWGDEIENQPNDYKPEYNEYKHTHNIGGIVSKNYDITEYYNLSINGASNQHIIYQLINYLNSDYYESTDVILIGLTSPMRTIIYSNAIDRYVGNWPNWNLESFLECTNDEKIHNNDFQNWWKYHVEFNINGHNDVLSYIQTCFTIKGLLKNHKNYIVWQSIDSKFWEVYDNEDFKPVQFQIQLSGSENLYEKNQKITKEQINTLLKRETSETQIWINIDELSWMDWLEINYNRNDVFAWSSNHPKKEGVLEWFDNILKKYLDKIFV